AQQVDVHDPTDPFARLGTRGHDPVGHVTDPAADQDLVGGADVGTPPDVVVGVGGVPKGEIPVEHDDLVGVRTRRGLGKPTAGGDVNRLADAVGHDAVRRGERTRAGHTRDHLDVEVEV